MNAMDQQWLYLTLDKAVQKYLQSDMKQSIATGKQFLLDPCRVNKKDDK